MGGEFGQRREWAHDDALEWWVLQYPEHSGLRNWVGDLNRVLRTEPALHEVDFDQAGFEWIDCHDSEASVIAFLRKSRAGEMVVVACNFTPLPRENYVLGVPAGGFWRELLNSDAPLYGGTGVGNYGGVEAAPVPAHGRMHSVTVTLPPLGVMFLKGGGGHG
jgi:1,4-alpha-glucan branching enzyme